MKFLFVCLLFSLTAFTAFSQETYIDSLTIYIDSYVKTHEVVTGNDKKLFRFYPINEKYRIYAKFEKVQNGKWFNMKTFGPTSQVFRVYGVINFTINDTTVKLNIYQSQNLMNTNDYKEYLFLPFTDLTTGTETYSGGRYIDLDMTTIKNNTVVIDFNKAYNPYCAYVSDKYNCPIPPRENDIKVAILAGEKTFAKSH